jgi:hypothetical protein
MKVLQIRKNHNTDLISEFYLKYMYLHLFIHLIGMPRIFVTFVLIRELFHVQF